MAAQLANRRRSGAPRSFREREHVRLGRASLARERRIQLLAGLLGPLIGFIALLHALGNATEALAVTSSIPMLWVLAYALWRRRIEPAGATASIPFQSTSAPATAAKPIGRRWARHVNASNGETSATAGSRAGPR
ncbi:MAG: hypothetical protein JO181_15450 [Solirubrobacterales bacterium]|nr:hypothetical protein [Solirubrobacterales bacterium]